MTIDGTLVEILRRKGFSYYDDRTKLVVDEWSINGGYNQENWYENLFGKLVLSNTISMKYQKLFDQLEKIIDEIELFGKNGILQKRIRERLKEQKLDCTDETKLALDQSKANIGIKRFESLQAFLQDLWDDRDGYFQEGSKTQEGYKKGMLYMTIKDDFQDTEEIARNKIYEAGYNEGYNEGYAVGCQECWEEATSEVRACPVRACPCKP